MVTNELSLYMKFERTIRLTNRNKISDMAVLKVCALGFHDLKQHRTEGYGYNNRISKYSNDKTLIFFA